LEIKSILINKLNKSKIRKLRKEGLQVVPIKIILAHHKTIFNRFLAAINKIKTRYRYKTIYKILVAA